MNSSLERMNTSNSFMQEKFYKNTKTERVYKRASSELFGNNKLICKDSNSVLKKAKKNRRQNVKLRFINLDQPSDTKQLKRDNSVDLRRKPISPLRYIPPEEHNRGRDAKKFREILKQSKGGRSVSEPKHQNLELKPYKHKLENKMKISTISKYSNLNAFMKSPWKEIDLSSPAFNEQKSVQKTSNYNKYLNKKTAVAHIDFSETTPEKNDLQLTTFQSIVDPIDDNSIQIENKNQLKDNETDQIEAGYKRSNSRSQPGQGKLFYKFNGVSRILFYS